MTKIIIDTAVNIESVNIDIPELDRLILEISVL